MATGEISATQYCRTTALKEKKMSWDLLFEEDKSSFTLVQIQISFFGQLGNISKNGFLSLIEDGEINTSRIAWLSRTRNKKLGYVF